MFQNRPLLIATKHQKERVIAPILEKELGVICRVDASFDTDILGTFTGEVERKLDPLATVREKCLRAMKHNHCDLGVASEGSFGAHPSVFFVNADDEFLIFIDLKNQLEIIVREISTDTNFNGKTIQSQSELRAFAEAAEFPSHGLILRKAHNENTAIYKGITDWETLQNTYALLSQTHQSVYVETDMRAMEIDYVRVYQQSTSAISEVKNAHLSYPNPVKETLNVYLGKGNAQNVGVKIYHSNAALVKEATYPVENDRIVINDWEGLSTGMYYLVYEWNGQLFHLNFCKE